MIMMMNDLLSDSWFDKIIGSGNNVEIETEVSCRKKEDLSS